MLEWRLQSLTEMVQGEGDSPGYKEVLNSCINLHYSFQKAYNNQPKPPNRTTTELTTLPFPNYTIAPSPSIRVMYWV